MGVHRNFDNEDIFYASWTDALQEYIGNFTDNFRLYRINDTTVGLKDIGAGIHQVAIGFGGPWRYRSSAYELAINGGAGVKDIYAVAVTGNDFSGPGKDPDETDYDFELRAVAAGSGEPEGVALSRFVGYLSWDGSKITALVQTLDHVTGAMIDGGAFSGTQGDISWAREASGAWVPNLKANSVGSTEVEADSITASEIAPATITDAEVHANNKDGNTNVYSLRRLGIGSKEACPGNDGRLSDERTPKDDSTTNEKVAKALREILGTSGGGEVRRGKSMIATEHSTASTGFVLLTTPDRVQNIVLPTDGLIAILYMAQFKSTAPLGGEGAIFLGNEQIRSRAATVDVRAVVADTTFKAISTSSQLGLTKDTAGTAAGADVDTGQIAGVRNSEDAAVCYIFAKAGTYDVSVRYRRTGEGSVTVKERKLWVWTMGF